MTLKELKETLAAMPQNASVFVLFDKEVTVLDKNGDNIRGKTEEYHEIDRCFLGKCFYAGNGFCPAVILVAGEDV